MYHNDYYQKVEFHNQYEFKEVICRTASSSVRNCCNPAHADHAQVTISIVPNEEHSCMTPDSCISPHEVVVDTGGKVIWSNDGDEQTAVISGTIDDKGAGSVFDSKVLEPGQTFSFKFEKAGEYRFFSPSQPCISGVVMVEDTHEHHEDESMDDDHHDNGHHGMSHEPVESEVPISVDIRVDAESGGDINVHIITSGWR